MTSVGGFITTVARATPPRNARRFSVCQKSNVLQLSHERRRRGMPDVSLSVKNLTGQNRKPRFAGLARGAGHSSAMAC